jgi:hypothetical protein
MNHTSWEISNEALEKAVDTSGETSNIAPPTPTVEVGKEEAAFADCHPAHLTFDGDHARQARAKFIQATIIFFGLDGDCPSLRGILEA